MFPPYGIAGMHLTQGRGRPLHFFRLPFIYELTLHLALKSRWIKLAVFVARMEEMRNIYNILVGKPERKDRRIILERILGK